MPQGAFALEARTARQIEFKYQCFFGQRRGKLRAAGTEDRQHWPVKRGGNRRYYQHHEVLLIRRIRQLLYEDGFTISGARSRLDQLATKHEEIKIAPVVSKPVFNPGELRREIREVLALLQA